ncbi:N-acetylmannosamine-6-phosphate 2-epimerase [[Clostridium] colinum]|uniref:N-acetylmannosamine-6-phosphate 2-epimerase n=1 Tax=[Clostridium] colinum TaxID=36835 RepID=UPI00202406C6|nr:N-acetylmannosamine-6-phosphate 2-epimerase [[Clostridium] colinum]
MKNGLIVSCQALENEPLHSSFIMGKMALAAYQGGAVGIRANSVEDIKEVKNNVNLPIIGIIKKDYENLIPYITPTIKEVEALVNEGVDIIALDATINQDKNFLKEVIEKYKGQKFMADISTYEEGIRADKIGFHYVGTTLIGYTEQSKNMEKFEILEKLIKDCKNAKIIAEGNFNTPEQAKKAIDMGAYAVVVGSAITRPQLITKTFADALK